MLNNSGKVALVSGFWAQNIGNAFFNLGGKRILEDVFTDHQVEFIQDQPGYWTFNLRRNPKNNIGILKHIETDYIVLQGPVLSKIFTKLWPETLKALKKKGTKLILLSAGLFKYSDEEISNARTMLKKFPPHVISTRDHKTYEVISDCCERTYSGIDSGFFVNDVYKPFQLDFTPYITMNFDRQPEPEIKLKSSSNINNNKFKSDFEFDNNFWYLRSPKLQKYLAGKGKIESYLGAMLDFRRLPSTLGPFTVVRPEHRFAPHVGWKIYKQPNAIVADEPFTYLTTYAGTSLTLSDRVHACVATLAYGKPAMLFSPSPRTYLFDRLGLSEIRNRPLILDKNILIKEKQLEIDFFKDALNS